jgi:hypothetical protein
MATAYRDHPKAPGTMYSLGVFFPQNSGFIILNPKSLFLIVWESTGLGMMIFWIRLLC